jgi:CMP-N-acetylneuraminic acid synthetase
MLTYTIEAALTSGVFNRVFVSTEDNEIAAIADSSGALVHSRSMELAGDLVSATEVCLDVYTSRKALGEDHDSIICLQPSSPLRNGTDVVTACRRFSESQADYLVSVTAIDPHYFHWALQENGDWWEMTFGDKYLVERQYLPLRYRPNGAIKIARAEPLIQSRNFFGPKLSVYEMPEERSVHVAMPMDFELAEFLMKKSLSTGGRR